jgi:hypothetical protein
VPRDRFFLVIRPRASGQMTKNAPAGAILIRVFQEKTKKEEEIEKRIHKTKKQKKNQKKHQIY